MAQTITMIITAVVAAASLILSIVNYFDKRPHIKIKINDKNYDCIYTIAGSKKNSSYHYVSLIHFNIINNSPVKITINNTYLLVNKEIFFLADPENDYWNSVDFFIKNEEGEFESDNMYRDYRNTCIKLPIRIEPYDSITVSAIFNSIPNNYNGNVKAKMVFDTAIGTIHKKIILTEYGSEHLKYEMDNVDQYLNSTVDINEINIS